ncbi:MAG: pyrimidine 5'-nucleotidase [Burkholderiaceae bacterium]
MSLPRRWSVQANTSASGAQPVWLLDLDNTLHDAFTHTFPLIKASMGDFIARELAVSADRAGEIRDDYGRQYGATLLGLTRHHGVDPHRFLNDVHPVSDLHGLIGLNASLRKSLQRLPGRRVLLTNAPRAYANKVTRLLGVHPFLDDLIAIEDMHWIGQVQPKPSRAMFRRIVAAQRVPASQCILVEDSVPNLRHARAVGMRGVLVTGYVAGLGARGSDAVLAGRALSSRRVVHRIRSIAQLPALLGKLRLQG